MKFFYRKYLILIVLLGLGIKTTNSTVQESVFKKPEPMYQPLIKHLSDQGYPEVEIAFLFSDPRVKFYNNMAYSKFAPKEITDSENPYLKQRSNVKDAATFMDNYSEYLEDAELKYGVEKEVITAILYVESKLGKNFGNHAVFNVLVSKALAAEPQNKALIREFVQEKYSHMSNKKQDNIIDYLENRCNKNAYWAKIELEHLVDLHLEKAIDIHNLPGSYAGAIGYPQFMPSNVERYGIDGDGDGSINLYDFPDAIFSIANFLQRKGWDEEDSSKKRALLKYNYSNKYVAEILEVASNFTAYN